MRQLLLHHPRQLWILVLFGLITGAFPVRFGFNSNVILICAVMGLVPLYFLRPRFRVHRLLPLSRRQLAMAYVFQFLLFAQLPLLLGAAVSGAAVSPHSRWHSAFFVMNLLFANLMYLLCACHLWLAQHNRHPFPQKVLSAAAVVLCFAVSVLLWTDSFRLWSSIASWISQRGLVATALTLTAYLGSLFLLVAQTERLVSESGKSSPAPNRRVRRTLRTAAGPAPVLRLPLPLVCRTIWETGINCVIPLGVFTPVVIAMRWATVDPSAGMHIVQLMLPVYFVAWSVVLVAKWADAFRFLRTLPLGQPQLFAAVVLVPTLLPALLYFAYLKSICPATGLKLPLSPVSTTLLMASVSSVSVSITLLLPRMGRRLAFVVLGLSTFKLSMLIVWSPASLSLAAILVPSLVLVFLGWVVSYLVIAHRRGG